MSNNILRDLSNAIDDEFPEFSSEFKEKIEQIFLISVEDKAIELLRDDFGHVAQLLGSYATATALRGVGIHPNVLHSIAKAFAMKRASSKAKAVKAITQKAVKPTTPKPAKPSQPVGQRIRRQDFNAALKTAGNDIKKVRIEDQNVARIFNAISRSSKKELM
jgi:hypothetical protein